MNHYELIRKYLCGDCGEVMMCDCEQSFAERFLPHQLDAGYDLRTRRRIPVTIGFQPEVCNACRGLPEEPYPKAELYGRSSKIVRYYWREIYFDTTEKLAAWAEAHGMADLTLARKRHPDTYDDIERQVIAEWKIRHSERPKYVYDEQSQQAVIDEYGVCVRDLAAEYLSHTDGGVRLFDGTDVCTPEEYVTRHYQRMGWQVISTESRPFHALFGVMMWMLIQDPQDPLVSIAGFGDRHSFDRKEPQETIYTLLPQDFGCPGYALRRSLAVRAHLRDINNSGDDLLWLFDYWAEPSNDLRQYLWAHHKEDMATARKLIEVLPGREIVKTLEYLVGDYWGRYLGWPDLLVYRNDLFFLSEVKSSGDKLRENQKSWIVGNANHLGWPFEIARVHRTNRSR